MRDVFLPDNDIDVVNDDILIYSKLKKTRGRPLVAQDGWPILNKSINPALASSNYITSRKMLACIA